MKDGEIVRVDVNPAGEGLVLVSGGPAETVPDGDDDDVIEATIEED